MDKKQWDQFLAPYKQAVEELKVKLKGIRKLYEFEDDHSPVEFVIPSETCCQHIRKGKA